MKLEEDWIATKHLTDPAGTGKRLQDGMELPPDRECKCGGLEFVLRTHRPRSAVHVNASRYANLDPAMTSNLRVQGPVLDEDGPWVQCTACKGWANF